MLTPTQVTSRRPRATLTLWAVLVLVIGFSPSLSAGTKTWTGGGGNGNWNTSANWNNGTPVAGDDLVFPFVTLRLANTNDFVNRNFNSITLSGSNYVIQGNALSVSNNFSAQNPAGTNTFNPALTLGKPESIECTALNATLILGGALNLGTNNTIFNAVGRLQITNVISGSGTLTKNGAGILRFEGNASNTFTNVTAMNGGTLELAKIPSAIAVAGRIIVGNGAVAATLRNVFGQQIADASDVVINRFSTWDLNDQDESVAGLTLNGGNVATGIGTLTLGGNVAALASATSATITGNLSLGGTTRTFDVAAGAASPNLSIAAVVSDGAGSSGLIQTGSGQMTLSGANTYSGPTTVNGLLTLANDSALGAGGSGASGTTVNGTLAVSGVNIGNEFLTLNTGTTFQSSGVAGWAGPVTLNGNVFFNVLPGSFTNSGVLSGNGGITKAQSGTLILSGASDNTYLGNTVVNQGVLQLSKSAGVAIQQGSVIIGDDLGGNDADVVRYTTASQISAAANIVINSSGLLDLNDSDASAGPMTLSGGHVTTGLGTLTLFNDVTVNPSANNFSRIDGRLALNGTRVFTINDSSFLPDLQINSTISGASGLTKNGLGELSLTASNSYDGLTTVNAGVLEVHESSALGANTAGTFVFGGACVLIGGVHVGVEPLTLNGGGINTFSALSGTAGSNSWDGVITLGSDASISAIYAGDFLNLAGAIDGTGNLSKNGTGTVIFSGASANTYAGATFANDGTLLLAKSIIDGAIPGALTIGNGGPAVSDVVRVSNGSQISDSSDITINSSGLLDLSNFSEGIGTLSGAGRVNLGSGGIVLNGNGNAIYSGVIAGPSGSLSKNGSGAFTLGGNNTYSSGTFINSGTLVVNGAQPISPVNIGFAGTLSGSGTVGNITSSGHVAPAVLTSSNAVFDANTIFTADFSNTGSGPSSQLNVRGAVNLGGAQLAVQPASTFAPIEGQQFVIINNDGADGVIGTFQGLPNNSVLTASNGLRFHIRYSDALSNDVVLTVTNTAARVAGVTVTGGNGNAIVDINECNFLSVAMSNVTAGILSGVSATLVSKTPGVSVTYGTAVYPDINSASVRTNTPPFQFTTSPVFPCGTNLQFDLIVTTVANGSFTIPLSVPSGSGGPGSCLNAGGGCESCPENRTITGVLGAGSLTQTGRLIRLFTNVNCGFVKTCPGAFGSVLNHYDAYVFENGETNACVTVTLTAACDLFSAAYTNGYNSTNLCQNYLSDMGGSTGATGSNSYSFNVTPRMRFVVVVSEVDMGGCGYTLRVNGGSCRPWLTTSPVAGGKVVFDWSTAAIGYGLEETNVLRVPPPPTWAPSTPLPSISKGRFRVTNNFPASTRFYELRKP